MELSPLPGSWDDLPPHVAGDVTILAFDASTNTVVASRHFGNGVFRPPGYTHGPIGPEGIVDAVHPDDMGTVLESIERLATMAVNEVLVSDLRTFGPSGKIVPVHCETTVLTRDRTGRPRIAKVVITPGPGP